MSVRVLVVDDERNLVMLLRGYLEREGFEAHEGLDGNSALEVARRVDPDVVILDWMLPGSDDMEVLRELRLSPKPTSSCSPLARRRSTGSWVSPPARTTT